MLPQLLDIICCPITGSKFSLQIIAQREKYLDGKNMTIISEGILSASSGCFYPVIKGIPRLLPEAVIDYEDFFQLHLNDFDSRKTMMMEKYGGIVSSCVQKNKKTKESFAQEWAMHDPNTDRTWDADRETMIERFFTETGETAASLQGKIILDAGCGNGLLNVLLAEKGIAQVAMDFSTSIEKPFEENTFGHLHFIQADVQYPPLRNNYFDLVHCSGVLIHTNNTHTSFQLISRLVKTTGKLSVWLYHPRKDFVHNLFNSIRKRTSRLPLRVQYYLYRFTIFPVSYLIKKIKGSKQNSREMMVDILDWFTPEFRWEHTHEEAKGWFVDEGYDDVRVTTNALFGFNMTGVKR